jgi:hypothetical protein
MELVIKKSGRLLGREYGKTKYRDRTAAAPVHLYDPCILAEDVTLRDVFLLLNKHLKLFDTIFGNCCKEIVSDGLSKRDKRDLKTDDIDYLELYFEITEYEHGKKYPPETSGLKFPQFHGVGVLKNDSEHQKKGETVQWGVELTEAWKLASYPLRLRKTVQVVREKPKENETLATLRNPIFSLGHILYGIIWELSFYGPPAKVKKFRASLDKMVADIESGKAKTVPFEPEKWRKEANKKRKKSTKL